MQKFRLNPSFDALEAKVCMDATPTTFGPAPLVGPTLPDGPATSPEPPDTSTVRVPLLPVDLDMTTAEIDLALKQYDFYIDQEDLSDEFLGLNAERPSSAPPSQGGTLPGTIDAFGPEAPEDFAGGDGAGGSWGDADVIMDVPDRVDPGNLDLDGARIA